MAAGNGEYTGKNSLPNTVGAAPEYIKSIMDELVAVEAKTNGMTPDPAIVRAAGQAGAVYLATIETTGLGNYSERAGYPIGAAKNTWAQYMLTHNRGIRYIADSMETIKSGGIDTAVAFMAEAMRSHIIPEIDATRLTGVYTALSSASMSTHISAEASALTAANLISKIITGLDTVADDYGTDSGATIYLNSSLRTLLHTSSEYTKTKNIEASDRNFDTDLQEILGNKVVWVPSKRMYSGITYLDGYTNAYSTTPTTVDWTKFGYAKDTTNSAKGLNFVITAPNTAMGVVAINNPKIIPKEESEQYDADQAMIRIWHDVIVPKNKLNGCYVSVANA